MDLARPYPLGIDTGVVGATSSGSNVLGTCMEGAGPSVVCPVWGSRSPLPARRSILSSAVSRVVAACPVVPADRIDPREGVQREHSRPSQRHRRVPGSTGRSDQGACRRCAPSPSGASVVEGAREQGWALEGACLRPRLARRAPLSSPAFPSALTSRDRKSVREARASLVCPRTMRSFIPVR